VKDQISIGEKELVRKYRWESISEKVSVRKYWWESIREKVSVGNYRWEHIREKVSVGKYRCESIGEKVSVWKYRGEKYPLERFRCKEVLTDTMNSFVCTSLTAGSHQHQFKRCYLSLKTILLPGQPCLANNRSRTSFQGDKVFVERFRS